MARITLLITSVLLLLIVNAPVVTVQSGPIRGGDGRTIGLGKPYYFFRGIPFAEPPIGKLRFQPPVPIRSWKHVLNTTQDKDECVQGVNPVTGSENCLFINVYTPQLSLENSTGLAVMVWIYGGGFAQGNSSYHEYGPDYFLDDNVIVVTFNYRLGIFGYLSTGDLVVPGNNGMKDQVLALRWVQRNIASFGGDPSKVTIFGESAGSASVSYHLQSPLSQGLYSAAIMESGTTLCLWALSRYAKTVGLLVGELLLVNTSSSESLVNGLREIDFKTLQTVSLTENILMRYFSTFHPLTTFVYAPVMEPDHLDAFFTGKSHQQLSKGKFNRVPTIIGFNSGEMGPVGSLSSDIIERVTSLGQITPFDMNVDHLTSSYVGYLIRKHYMGFKYSTKQSDLTITYLSDTLFNRPIRETVRLQSSHAPVYYYEFTYEGALGFGTNRSYPGAYHTEELRYLWLININGSIGNPTRQDEIVRARMVKLWTNFAKYKNPTPSHTAKDVLGSIQWPSASQESTSSASTSTTLKYLDIGTELKLRENPKEENWQFWRNLYESYGNPPYETY